MNTDNAAIANDYSNFLRKSENAELVGLPFDIEYLDDYRSRVAKYMRDNTYYGFSSSYINFDADTNSKTMKVILGINFTDRMIFSDQNRDSLIPIKLKTTYIHKVYFRF